MHTDNSPVILQVKHLTKRFTSKDVCVRALTDVLNSENSSDNEGSNEN